MLVFRPFPQSRCASAFMLFSLSLLAGCAGTAAFPNAEAPGATINLQGRVHGGQQPVTGSHVHVLQAASSAYGAASTSLITNSLLSDSIGEYVATDGSGDFSITGSYTCTAGAQVYILATQGNPGLASGTNNTSIALMAGLGACPDTRTFLAATPVIFVDEVSTVATAYALAGFFTDATHLASDGSTLALTGMTNAGANIAALSGIATGAALTTTPNGAGAVPNSEINLLANILASCINTSGSGCPALFALTPSGTATPTDTATAMINIAHHPGVNVGQLFALASSSGPFQPAYASAPNDYTITINYTPATARFASAGGHIAIDAAGNVWGPGKGLNSAVELSPLGATLKSIAYPAGGTGNGQYAPLNVFVSPSNGYIWVANYQAAYAAPTASAFTAVSDTGASWAASELAVAFDTSGNVWTANNYPASFGELTASGTLVAASTNGYEPGGFAPLTSPATYPSDVLGDAVDSANHIWGICNKCNGTAGTGLAAEITNTGVAVSGTGGDHPASIVYPSGLALDASNNVWITDFSTGYLTEYSSTSTLLSGTGYPAGGGLGNVSSIAIDGSSNIFAGGNQGTAAGILFELNNAGALVSPPGGYQALGSTAYYSQASLAVDGSGNVWALDQAGGMHESIGLATPVVTPITPSALGKRP